ncbi:leucine-rich repeat-containing protein 14B-like [Callorhinchus milii]|uniref:Leucine-rich repeat-containing protein 14B n=2 Tax=Callorhinchus milii TaxID=7868 RepID=A0A4W3JA05_CALMI|nr:leucine-rich repeat-containing protein 14B-like [Callorhinchus milii]|eukprot:gi/632968958/ref/XP_007900821.1/ PREDICTED: leucine-rich repeat-containing protein 14B-like [Callorhinchus milii]
MKTLKFMSAQALVSDAQIAQRSLVHVAYNLYPLLFKASYLLEQPTVLHDLVETWPLAEFSIGKMLGKTADCEDDLSNRTCEACLRACFTGLKDYVLNSSGTYSKKLKLVDLTGLHDVESQQCTCKKALGRWGRTVLLVKACLDLLVEMDARELDIQSFDISIDVLVSAFVTERIYEAMVQALCMRNWCPLKIRILEFRADNLALHKFFYMIKLIQPETLLKLELVHNIRMEMKHFEILLNHVPLPLLRSLTLPARAFDVRGMTPEDEVLLVMIGEKLSTMKHLAELNLPFSILTGRIRRLLSPLKSPLRVLDLSYCSMNHADMAYLANSLHAEYLEELDLSGQSVAELFPSTFFKLLGRASRTLRKLTLEECDISDNQVHMIILALESCRQLREFNFLGNPLTSHALHRLFLVFTELPALRKVEFPVPKDCYPDTFTYPLTEENMKNYDGEKFEKIRQDLLVILLRANRDDIILSTPLFGVFDSELQETSNEANVVLLQSFVDVISSFLTTLD